MLVLPSKITGVRKHQPIQAVRWEKNSRGTAECRIPYLYDMLKILVTAFLKVGYCSPEHPNRSELTLLPGVLRNPSET